MEVSSPQRKRQKRPRVYNPVYPYGEPERLFITPFFSSQGFTQDPPGTLALKLGAGLYFGSNGELEVSGSVGQQLTASAPVTIVSGQIGLRTQGPLVVQNDTLGLSVTAPLQVDIPSGNPTAGSLALNLADTLQVTNNQLTLATPQRPIQLDSDGTLKLQYTTPIALGNNGLTLSLGQGLETANSNLRLKLAAPIVFSSGAASLSIDSSSPLILKSGALSLSVGAGLEVTSAQSLQVKLGTGLEYDSSQGLSVSSSVGALPTLQAGTGLIYNAQGELAIQYSNTFTILAGSAIGLKTPQAPLKFDSNGSLEMSLQEPLRLFNNDLGLATGEGLKQDDSNALAVSLPNYTMWTTLSGAPLSDGTLHLTISRMQGPLVVGYARFYSSSSVASTGPKTYTILFDSDGRVLTDSSASAIYNPLYMDIQNGSSTSSSSTLDRLMLMPNKTLYPASNASPWPAQSIKIPVTYGTTEQDGALIVRLNYFDPSATPTASYGITLSWTCSSSTIWRTNIACFNYIAQNLNPPLPQ